jgi:hypothetical protein
MEEERALVERFAEKARAGGLPVVVSAIHRAYECAVGHAVPKSTVYRMLARQGWKKVAPRSRHPQNDPTARADFKKSAPTSSRGREKSKPH